MLSRLADRIKNFGTVITTILSIVAAIGGAIIYVENNFANAYDVREVVKNQSRQIEMYQQSQRQNQMFQLEYYDSQIKKLELERNRNTEILDNKSVTPAARALTRRPEDVQDEINELKSRREVVKRNLVESEKSK
jgi:hypothetical protein